MSGQEVILGLRNVQRVYSQPVDLLSRLGGALKGGVKPRSVQAVAGVDLDVMAGEVIGIVGESGCGKSTLGRMLTGILPPSAGEIRYRGRPVAQLIGNARREYELGVQMIFQDPYSSLNPRMRVIDIIGEGPVVHGMIKSGEKEAYVSQLMRKVGLDPSYRYRYPHQFSGGQRQRIGVARALAVKPSVIVCDEAVAALDVSIQAQVLNLFMQLRKEYSLTYFFISHNLGVVSHLSDRVAIMYLGRIVEIAPAQALYTQPLHPYTEALLSAVPIPDPTVKRKRIPLQGDVPSPLRPPSGCHFHTRCPIAQKPLCSSEKPQLKQAGDGHWVACHLRG